MAEPRRLQLQLELENLMADRGPVFFEPDRNVRLRYPCIVYNLNNVDFTYTNDLTYIGRRQYDLIIIDRDPDSDIPKLLEEHGFHMLSFDRAYIAENLHHFVYKLYY